MADKQTQPPAPQRAGAVFVVRVACRDLKRLKIRDGMTFYRLATDGGVFFFDGDRFDADVLKRGLRRNEAVTIGAHRLRDGSAWLHWLERADGRLWSANTDRRRWLAPLLLALCWLPGGLAWHMTFSTQILWALLRVGLMATAVGMFGWSVYRLALACHPGRRRLRAAYRAVKQGQRPRPSVPPVFSAPPALSLGDGIHGRLGVLQDTLRDVHVVERTYGSGQFSYSLNEYTLVCSGGEFGIRTGAWDWRSLIDPVLIRRAPFFVAAGDRVTLLTSLGDGEVRGLLNHSDGIAHINYTATAHTPMGRRALSIVGGAVTAFIVVMMLSFELYDWYDRGVAPDYWDWLDLLSLLGVMALMLTLFGAVAGFIGERIHHFYYRRRQTPALGYIVGIAYQWRLRQGRSAILSELS
ncbi:hypothetical protein [Salinisphaera sp. Q1T1-3]|uniref:hypothetical protein n=1 Tax=Salinisphaera sp. Q1T1-3 TaxID=2321229 RepID=UPI000E72B768|nr:hypothetical protein [Salinisphaera sp. Q1T1-3]RJS93606.1 hypothetical protein D3260_07980 [Salinisphaera sp. Q1T1-3]